MIQKIVMFIDGYLFIKNGYSIMVHLIPFIIAGLLLLVTSLPAEDLLSELANVLQKPSIFWIPCILLTVIATAIYLFTVKLQVSQAYLWPEHKWQRFVVTSFVYVFLCSCMAFLVLAYKTTSPNESPAITTEDISFGNIWACFLLAAISLMGVGWNTPSSLAASTGIKSPDYSKSHLSAEKITERLNDVRGKSIVNNDEVKKFKDLAQELQSNIKDNKDIEPTWAKAKVNNAYEELGKLIEQIQKEFLDNPQNVNDFAAACRYQNEPQYPDFVAAIKNLSNFWIEWKYPK